MQEYDGHVSDMEEEPEWELEKLPSQVRLSLPVVEDLLETEDSWEIDLKKIFSVQQGGVYCPKLPNVAWIWA